MSKRKIACYAAGVIGSSFAVNFAMSGMDCFVYVTNDDRKMRGSVMIDSILDSLETIGAISAERHREIRDHIVVTTDAAEAFKGADLIQENGPEKLDVKQEIMDRVELYAPEDAVIASSTSGMPVTEISAKMKHPERCIGAHPFNPPHLIPLVEITKGEKTQEAKIQKAIAIYREAGKEPVVLQKEKKGFIANRFSHAVLREAWALVEEGVCTPEDADRALVYGPGIRWASVGQFMIGELGTRGGVAEGMRRFAPMSASIIQDLSTLQEMPEDLPDLAVKGVETLYKENADCIGHTKEEVSDFRDRVLVEVLRLHGKI